MLSGICKLVLLKLYHMMTRLNGWNVEERNVPTHRFVKHMHRHCTLFTAIVLMCRVTCCYPVASCFQTHVQLSKYIQKAEQNISMAQKGLSSFFSSPHASTEHLSEGGLHSTSLSRHFICICISCCTQRLFNTVTHGGHARPSHNSHAQM